MAGGKEIRTQIKSIKNTQKITRAMQMVAASKMRKSQQRMLSARPYAEKIRTVISHLAHAHTEYRPPALMDRPVVKKVGYIVISTDRGLCGGLNSNLFKAAVQSMREWQAQGVESELCTVGTKATVFFRRLGLKILGSSVQLGDNPRVEDLVGSVKVMFDRFSEGEIDRVYLVHNVFVNTMTQEPRIEVLAPVTARVEKVNAPHRWDYLYEPDAPALLDSLLVRYVESLVYQGLVENVACEMAARMIAMKSATDNAGELINEMQLVYNKARQAAITQELTEIVAGAAAV
ncbi:F0F1 ATP synthase subunit gamma [Plasticicumulans acidivorans]|uniref:ATP synthase gamma chain n=1 Tax=Plasticicumulans acidivorans TaxID=886464 RepID=A0A317MWC0_9GAMM|nr:F0F1 ATP synthase subunit gamma [Plasticicumulans acidivorans]PWV62373.1 ATP synthase F1 subcomplex gamma subunit [Plasticicumulans acidivorans]